MEIAVARIQPFIRFVRYLTMTPNTRYPICAPYDARMFAVIEGEGRIEADGNVYDMRVGDVIFINSAITYHLKSPTKYVKYFAVNLDYVRSAEDKKAPVNPDEISTFDRSRLLAPVSFSDSEELSRVLFVSGMTDIHPRLDDLKREYDGKAELFELSLSAIMCEIVTECIRHRRPTQQSRVDQIIAYIRENLDKRLSNDDIAEKFHYHKIYVSDLISRHTGMSLHKYVTGLRISHATYLLAYTDDPIGKIAVECGFYDTAHFVKCFREVMGMTPGKYRARLR